MWNNAWCLEFKKSEIQYAQQNLWAVTQTIGGKFGRWRKKYYIKNLKIKIQN